MLLTEYDVKKQRLLDKRDWIEESERIDETRSEDRYASSQTSFYPPYVTMS